ncbi:MAG: hypothetical protein MI745_08325 [Pseudomonadales bacterium]|nr:hypothetical protein [Pseudomonadales bacterium]
MTTLLWFGVIAAGVALIGTGLYYHIRRRALQSDPILIGSCYLSGAGLLAGNWLVPML